MRQVIIGLSLLVSFVIFALTVQLFDVLVMFLLFGILPGQARPLSANQMLAIYGGATVLVAGYALRGHIASLSARLRTKAHPAAHVSQS